jgi:hypothetical protein
MSIIALCSVVLAGWAIAALFWGRTALRGVTMMAPWAWSVASLASLSVVQLLDVLNLVRTSWLAPLAFAAAMTTFCPAMAVLGAKRPQNGPWRFVVLTMLALLWMPVVDALLLRPGEGLHLAPPWRWFLLVMMLLGATNYLPTRFWPSALLVLTAQFCLIRDQLPLPAIPVAAPLAYAVGLALAACATLLVCIGWPASRAARGPFDRLWIDFRDTFGAVWGLRVQERMRALAEKNGWRTTFNWQEIGVADEEASASVEEVEATKQAYRSILWRFVPPRWIDLRLGESVD